MGEWAAFCEYGEQLSAEMERGADGSGPQRLRRAAARRGHSVDSTHPPTHLRRRCAAAGGPHPAGVVHDTARAAAVSAELAAARALLARRVIRDHAG